MSSLTSIFIEQFKPFCKPAKCLLSLAVMSVVNSGYAQTVSDDEIETIIITGSRVPLRTAHDSMVPVDVISNDALSNSVSEELMDKLGQVIPSYNVKRLPMSDGTTFIRPASLRGLAPNHTLVMVNGKRRHRSALLGNGMDLAMIPSSAIKRVEVLRDGASAQYGSDAIAGVINLVLDDQEGFQAYTQAGQYYEQDGENLQIGAKFGLDINDRGFLFAALELSNTDLTSRSVQRPDAVAFSQANPDIKIKSPVQRWGQPQRDLSRFAVNFDYDITDTTELYAFATYAKGDGETDFNWRNPSSNSAFKAAPTAFGDWTLSQVYPGGMTPIFGQDDTDTAIYIGVRTETSDSFHWDLSAGRGQNRIDYKMRDSINASFGSESPTQFEIGSYVQTETNINLDANYSFDLGLADDANLALGFETRKETFAVEQGDFYSHAIGPGAKEGLPSGSNGFPGFSPDQVGEWDKDSKAVFAELSLQVTDQFSLSTAIRYEDFNDFGSTTDGKVAMRFEVSDELALRASVSTGFRTPTPAELFSSRTFQGLTQQLEIFTNARLPADHPVSKLSGAKTLQEETSQNFGFGLVYQGDNGWYGSIDAYRIDVNDRISQAPYQKVTADTRTALLAAGVPGAESFNYITYYINNYDTQTQGVDFVTGYKSSLGEGSIDVTASFNWNDTSYQDAVVALGSSEQTRLEDGIPETSGNINVRYLQGSFDVNLRMRYYGEWSDASGLPADLAEPVQEFGSMALFDLSLGYEVNDNIYLSFGAENLFDSYPDKASFHQNRGLLYSRNAPYDTDGGLYYARVKYNF